MRYIPTVNDDSLKSGLVVSVVAHTLMAVFLIIELPRLVPPLPSHHGPIPFDIVTIGEVTNTRIGNGSPTTATENSAPPAPAPAASPQPPAPKPEPKPEFKPEPQPKPPMPAKPSPSVNDIIEGLKASKNEKPKPAAEKPAQQDLLGSVLKDVAKMKPSGAAVQGAQTEGKGAAPAGAALSGTGTQSGGFGGEGSSRLTITEEDALRRQIEQCWNPPVGARDAQSLVVEVVIDVNADRTVSNAEVVDKFKYATDPFFRAAADAAIRAVRNPKCNPLELAPDKYEQWKRINFTFDPRDML